MTLLPPPATIGIIGGGQLGMMTIREAHRMGYRTVAWDPDPDCPASALANDLITAPFDDKEAADRLAHETDVVTYEFENVDPDIVEWIEQSRPVFPGNKILRVSRHRRLEKEELRRRGFPTVDFRIARGRAELSEAVDSLGFPVVIKTATTGYDGKGQTILKSGGERGEFLEHVVEAAGEYVVEKFLDLKCELSVIAVRSGEGKITTFPVCENIHRENILHLTIVPSRVSARLQKEAVELGREIIDSFRMVGVLCVELFVTRDETMLVNELAPRPHNSGHFSLDACDVSQFEALVRSICGMPLEQPRLLSPCAMVNILGKHLGRLDVLRLHQLPGVKLHLYGKKETRPKRKMGHVTILGESIQDVERTAAIVERMIGESEVQPLRKAVESIH